MVVVLVGMVMMATGTLENEGKEDWQMMRERRDDSGGGNSSDATGTLENEGEGGWQMMRKREKRRQWRWG